MFVRNSRLIFLSLTKYGRPLFLTPSFCLYICYCTVLTILSWTRSLSLRFSFLSNFKISLTVNWRYKVSFTLLNYLRVFYSFENGSLDPFTIPFSFYKVPPLSYTLPYFRTQYPLDTHQNLPTYFVILNSSDTSLHSDLFIHPSFSTPEIYPSTTTLQWLLWYFL